MRFPRHILKMPPHIHSREIVYHKDDNALRISSLMLEAAFT